jgi:hypothetical protein
MILLESIDYPGRHDKNGNGCPEILPSEVPYLSFIKSYIVKQENSSMAKSRKVMEIPITLKTALRSGKAIPFVGSGVSMSALNKSEQRLFPSWRELLEYAADRLDSEQKPNDAQLVRLLVSVDPPKYLSSAEPTTFSLTNKRSK